MGIMMIGIDHTKAPIDIRTIFSFTKKAAAEAMQQLKQRDDIDGCVLISTCNRMELWLSTSEDFSEDLIDLLCDIRQVDPQYYRSYFQVREGQEAVHHLFRLTGGLESRILGEDQIITQVGDALVMSREVYAADHVMETLFRQAVTVAKKVKTDIQISHTDNSIVHTALETLSHLGMTFENKKCLVIGNGVMGKLTANSLRDLGAFVTVTVRQYRSGVVEIPNQCARIDYGNRFSIFGECDYVFSATVSPNYTLTAEQVAAYAVHPMVLVDLAVPRDIDPNAAKIDGITLFDVDSFQLQACNEDQKAAILRAEEYFLEQEKEFFNWYEGREVVVKIQNLKEAFAEDLMLRLQKKIRALPVEEETKKQLYQDISSAAERTMNKFLFEFKEQIDPASYLDCLTGMEKIYEG